ncbi:MAG TPA: hypothetical protein VGO73_07070 [Pyrinomonadaceae bacterium]|jgi:hypothetical protein|nr:hypothetical protein [Pyrinomonadaceae bacterium]
MSRHEPSLDQAFKKFFKGIAFLFVCLALWYTRTGYGWSLWLLIPAFSMMGAGIAQYMRLKQREKRSFPNSGLGQASMQSPRQVDAFPVRATGKLVAPPPSVTEGTTRHLGAEAPTRHFDDEVSS